MGVTRLLGPILSRGELIGSRSVPSAVLVAVTNEEERAEATDVATALRHRGIPCEVAPNAAKFGKQIRHADRRGIPFVWFGGLNGEVKDIRSGDQHPASASEWMPEESDIYPQVVSN